MKHTIVKCNCDKCNIEMTEGDYERAPKVSIRVDVPDPRGGSGDCNGLEMKICNDCAAQLGIFPEKIHNGQMGMRDRIKRAIEDNKVKILDMFFKKKTEV